MSTPLVVAREHLPELVTVLNDEAAVYQRLAELAAEGGLAIANRDIAVLSNVIAEQQTLSDRAAALERRRIAIIHRATGYTTTTIRHLIDAVDPEMAATLSALRAQLLDLVAAVERHNRANHERLTMMLSYLDERIQRLARTPVTYAGDGQTRSETPRTAL
ncbi:MAG: flagellar protein FlgN, partial [Dehalococcoidia bacterium]|nr:flagellar protein FlgN [Dehalococcoidia bacterium]